MIETPLEGWGMVQQNAATTLIFGVILMWQGCCRYVTRVDPVINGMRKVGANFSPSVCPLYHGAGFVPTQQLHQHIDWLL